MSEAIAPYAPTHLYVEARYQLPALMKGVLRNRTPTFGFNGLGEATYYRTYSRRKTDGGQEQWSDTVVRVVEGVMSIRMDWYRKVGLRWDETFWDAIAMRMADSMYAMRFLPPGRGLWAMGTDFVYERGAMALNNCAYCDPGNGTISDSVSWAMDALMCGVGVGFSAMGNVERLYPSTFPSRLYVIPDTREGWVESVRRLIASAEGPDEPPPTFDYSLIRGPGLPIRGFGGTSAGAAPLIALHDRIRSIIASSSVGEIDSTRLVVDLMNSVGACVVAGNVRRSAEIALGRAGDETFVNLKNPLIFPDRQDIAWMSNNSVVLESHDDFELLPSIADRIVENGEPGFVNMVNIKKYGRLFRPMPDNATGTNPCSEIALADRELCCLSEVFPTRCRTDDDIFEAMELATIYASTVSLLPTHRSETNSVMASNRRIGVSVSGVSDWTERTPISRVTRILRDGYKRVRDTNAALAREAGIPAAIRVTCVKPSGTISLLAGVSPGMHWPTFRHAVRRVRVSQTESKLFDTLAAAGIPHEPDVASTNTEVFEFPIDQGTTRAATEVSAWEQGARVQMLQREWADNMVSNTIYFDRDREARDVEHILSTFAPVVKTMSMLPHSDSGAYPQMPYEGITADEYQSRSDAISSIDWSAFSGNGRDQRFCGNAGCEL